ncbi:4Fe-4S binding protein [Lachnospiraceae bacterium LCP19S3_B12]
MESEEFTMAVYIDKELCKSCKICMNICPKNVFEITHHVNKKGYNYVEAVREEDCISCGQCETSCPDFVIHVE